MEQVDPTILVTLQTRVREFAEARFQMAVLGGEYPALVYETLDPKGTYADVLRSTTSYDEGTIDEVSTFAQVVFRDRWREMEDLHSATSASDRTQ